MRCLWAFVIFGLLIPHAGVCAEVGAPLQMATLSPATVSERLAGNVRTVEVNFGPRSVTCERLIDGSVLQPWRENFGQAQANSDYKKRLIEPSWLVDGAGDGYYFPSQPDFSVSSQSGVFFFAETNVVTEQTRRFTRLRFADTATDAMAKIGEAMVNPVLAPLQITENDDDELIVYDTETKITGYAISRPSERMNSAGYLSGSSQPCVVLIQANGEELTLATAHSGAPGKVRLKLFGEWKAAASSAATVQCEPKAGRTWVEMTAGPTGSEVVHLEKLPNQGYLERILRLFIKN